MERLIRYERRAKCAVFAKMSFCYFRAELRSFYVRTCPKKFSLLFRRKRGDDLLEARIAAERVPEGQQF